MCFKGPKGDPGPKGDKGDPGADYIPPYAVDVEIYADVNPIDKCTGVVYGNESRIYFKTVVRAGGGGVYYFIPDAQVMAAPLSFATAIAMDDSHGWHIGPAISRWCRTADGRWGLRIELTGGVDMGISGKAVLGPSYPNSNAKLIEVDIGLLK